MKILIMGGAGFVGANLSFYLKEHGYNVIALDNLTRRGVENNILEFKRKGITFIHGDIRNPEDFYHINADIILECSAQPSAIDGYNNPKYDITNNLYGVINVLEYCRINGSALILWSTNKCYCGNKINALPRIEKETRYIWPQEFPTKIIGADPLYGISDEFSIDGGDHSIYGMCFDRDTEILTESGWKSFPDLNKNDSIATLNKSQEIEYQKPLHKIKYNYNGKMFNQKNRRLDLLVTPNHRLYVGSGCTKNSIRKPRFSTPEEIFGKPVIYKVAADYKGGEDLKEITLPAVDNASRKVKDKKIKIDPWLRFLGWYISKGSFYKTKQGNYNVILSTYYRHEEAIKVFKDIGFHPILQKNGVFVSNKQLFSYVRQLGKSSDRHIPKEIKKLSANKLKIILKSLMNGNRAISYKRWKYTTISRQLADDVQEIAIKCGYSANISKNGFYRVCISTTKTVQCNLGKNKSSWVNYKGPVYCVSVPNEVILVRRNGKPYFSGNSKIQADIACQEYCNAFDVPTVVNRFSCLSGDTKIPLLNGQAKTIKELYDLKMKNFYVYSINNEGEIVPGKCEKVTFNGKKNTMLKVILDDGSFFKCTEDHLIMLRNGSYLQAGKLVPGQSLMPLYRRYKKTHEGCYDYEQIYNPKNNRFEYTHKKVIKYLYGFERKIGKIIHHKDYNRYNNSPNNLEIIDSKEHARMHNEQSKRPRQNPECRQKYLNKRSPHLVLDHKVTSIERISEEDVYDLINVSDFNNFAIDCGIFVHNCLAGERQWGKCAQGWVSWFAIAAILNLPIEFIGWKGKQVRDVLFIEDICNLIKTEIDNIDLIKGQVFNIGGGYKNTLSLIEAVNLIEKIIGYRPIIKVKENPRKADHVIYISDIRKIKNAIGWEPKINLETGYARIINWINNNKTILEGIYL